MARTLIPSSIRSQPIGNTPLRRRPLEKLGPVGSIGVVILSFATQSFLPRYVSWAGAFDLPLLITVYLALTERNVPRGILIGAVIGLAQDALSHGPIGGFGIIKTVIGYLAASMSRIVEIDYPGIRGILAALFFLIHHLLFWVMQTVLLGINVSFDPARTLVMSAAYAGLALLLFPLIDRLKRA